MEKLKTTPDKYISWFWRFFTGSFSLSAILTTFILVDAYNRYELCYSHECMNFFFSKIMFVPFSVLAAAVPICAIFLALHKSHQTKIQINETSKQNTASNYFMHKKEFASLCKELEKKHDVKLDATAIYSILFPYNNSNHVNLEYDGSGAVEKHLNYFSLSGKGLKNLYIKSMHRDYKVSLDDAFLAIRLTQGAMIDLGLPPPTNSKYKAVFDDTLLTFELPRKSLVECWDLYTDILREIAFFCMATPHLQHTYSLYKFDEFINSEDGIVIREV